MRITFTDRVYARLLYDILMNGDRVETRNHAAYSNFNTNKLTFNTFPLVTIRKTAWFKAIQEWEWFMSGGTKCPDNLASTWWKGQLNRDGYYRNGYGDQLRSLGNHFDQIEYLIDGLKHHPYSRRHVISTWDAADMSQITFVNNNPNTPTCCHTTLAQFHVRNGKLHMYSYQRSADCLLGLPHNLVQSWAFMLYLCHHTSLHTGSMMWQIGDAHIYDSPSHIDVAKEICEIARSETTEIVRYDLPYLTYTPTSKEFIAKDFSVIGLPMEPLVTGKPELF